MNTNPTCSVPPVCDVVVDLHAGMVLSISLNKHGLAHDSPIKLDGLLLLFVVAVVFVASEGTSPSRIRCMSARHWVRGRLHACTHSLSLALALSGHVRLAEFEHLLEWFSSIISNLEVMHSQPPSPPTLWFADRAPRPHQCPTGAESMQTAGCRAPQAYRRFKHASI